MFEEVIQKPEDVVRQTYGDKVIGHDKDLASIKEKLDQCYVRGERDFINDVEELVCGTIQKDESRKRIKEYAREIAIEVLREAEKTKSESSWKWKGILVPGAIALVAAILGAALLPLFEKLFK